MSNSNRLEQMHFIQPWPIYKEALCLIFGDGRDLMTRLVVDKNLRTSEKS